MIIEVYAAKEDLQQVLRNLRRYDFAISREEGFGVNENELKALCFSPMLIINLEGRG
jgi:hypothetical protein